MKQAPAVIELDALAASLNAIISQRCDRCGFFGHDESGCNGHDLQCRNCGEVGHLQAQDKIPNYPTKMTHLGTPAQEMTGGRTIETLTRTRTKTTTAKKTFFIQPRKG